jgi:hypothetical protein
MTILRGAIEAVTPVRVAGWIYSETRPVRDMTVLAMYEGRCVGAGEINIFRQDLADVGLGDGFLGFDFGIEVPKRGDEGRISVKLEGSDAVLLHAGSRVERADAINNVSLPVFRSTASLEWMRGRGWLEQVEIDFFKAIDSFGVYDRSLRVTKIGGKVSGTGASLLDPQQEAQTLFELLRMQPVNIREQRDASISDLAKQRATLAKISPEPVIALWSAKRSAFMVVEGSHHDDLPFDLGLGGAVEYAIGPDRLVMLDVRCRFGTKYEGELADLRTWVVAPDRAPAA